MSCPTESGFYKYRWPVKGSVEVECAEHGVKGVFIGECIMNG